MTPGQLGSSLARELQSSSPAQLRRRLLDGHPVDPRAIEGWAYRGTSVGLPAFIERLTWKTFQKTFWRDPLSGRLLGWNVRLEQDGLDAPSRPKTQDGEPVCCWHYEVIEPRGVAMPAGFDRGLIIDYGRGYKPTLDMRWVKDPLVALEPGNNDVLLGVSYAVILGACLVTPTWFTLERDHRIEFVPPNAAGEQDVPDLPDPDREQNVPDLPDPDREQNVPETPYPDREQNVPETPYPDREHL